MAAICVRNSAMHLLKQACASHTRLAQSEENALKVTKRTLELGELNRSTIERICSTPFNDVNDGVHHGLLR